MRNEHSIQPFPSQLEERQHVASPMTATQVRVFSRCESHVLDQLGPVGKRFTAITTLSDVECAALENCLRQSLEHQMGHELISPGSVLDTPRLLIAGWVCLSRVLSDGRRQIVDLYLPGDIVGFSSVPGVRAK